MVVSYLIIFISLRWLFHLLFVNHSYGLNFYFLSFLSCLYLYHVLQSRFSHYLKDPAVALYSAPTRHRYLKLEIQHQLFCPAASEIYLWIRKKVTCSFLLSSEHSWLRNSGFSFFAPPIVRHLVIFKGNEALSPSRHHDAASNGPSAGVDSRRWELSTSRHAGRRRPRDTGADGRLLTRRSFIFIPP